MNNNYISRTRGEETGMNVESLDDNRTLIIDQYNNNATDVIETYTEAKTLKEAFEYFKPSVDVNFQNENGETETETLYFNEIQDFEACGGKGKLVTNSKFLSKIKDKSDLAAKHRKQIEQNSRLSAILDNPQSRNELKTLLQSLLDELNEADNMNK